MKIILYKGNSLINRLIRFFSRGQYSHSSIILDDGTVYEASPSNGVSVKSDFKSGHLNNDIADFFEVKTTVEQDEKIVEFLKRQLGKKYDYLSVIGFIVYATPEKRKLYSRWFCSELISAAFKKVEINLLERTDDWLITPTTLSYSSKLEYKESITILSN